MISIFLILSHEYAQLKSMRHCESFILQYQQKLKVKKTVPALFHGIPVDTHAHGESRPLSQAGAGRGLKDLGRLCQQVSLPWTWSACSLWAGAQSPSPAGTSHSQRCLVLQSKGDSVDWKSFEKSPCSTSPGAGFSISSLLPQSRPGMHHSIARRAPGAVWMCYG